ncbi:MAG: class I SAM-dependent methyltransferase family protein [Candidatus Bathyarchaeota archaeon]|nr:class I SAM-dependent methyltransferase family protein [Candidatus Bathyarchaeota archaeon]
MPQAVCLKVSKIDGEKTIALASKLGIMDKTLIIQRDETSLWIPLIGQPDAEVMEKFEQISSLQVETADFTEKIQHEKTLTQALSSQLPPELLPNLPHAMDVIGDIAIIDIPPQLKEYESLIGAAVLETQKNVKTVLAKAGDISGTFRVRDYTFIAGENKTHTIHREYGCQYHVDIAKAYFSPRLSTEHQRVAYLVQADETVVDLFAGVGPFAVLIVKTQKAAKVYGVDLNPDAVQFLEQNVHLNKVADRVFPVLGDAREIAKTQLKGAADRVIMNLPETAIDFVDAACNALKPSGGVVHFYGFVRQPDTIEDLQQQFSYLVEKNGRVLQSFLCVRSIRETAPFESQVVLDAQIR